MPLYRNGERVVLFMHVPKTGGTSIEQALEHLGAVQAFKTPRRAGGRRQDKLSRISFQHLHYALLDEVVPSNFYDYGFAVVRHPLHRLASSFRWNTRNRSNPPSFDSWYLQRAWKHCRRTYYADNHMRPQSDFIGPGIEVFRFEDGLELPMRSACERLGLDFGEGHLPHEKRINTPKPLRVLADTMERVKQFYAEDFAQFGYDRESIPNTQFEVVKGRHPLSFLIG